MMSPKQTKNQKVVNVPTGCVFWHEARQGDRSLSRIAEVFQRYGETPPEALGTRAVFSKIETTYGRRASSRVFVRRVPATIAKDARREVMDVLEVVPMGTVVGRDYEVLGQVYLDKRTRRNAGYEFGITCEHGDVTLVADDVETTNRSSCGCKVWQYADELVNQWTRWRGPNAQLDGSQRGLAYIRLYEKHGAMGLSDAGRPYFFPSDEFLPWQIVRDLEDKVYVLPLTPEAKADVAEVSYNAFFAELKTLNDEISTWEDKVRDSTKHKRLEYLETMRKRLGLYGAVLGTAAADLEALLGSVEERIVSVLVGPAKDDAEDEQEEGGEA